MALQITRLILVRWIRFMATRSITIAPAQIVERRSIAFVFI